MQKLSFLFLLSIPQHRQLYPKLGYIRNFGMYCTEDVPTDVKGRRRRRRKYKASVKADSHVENRAARWQMQLNVNKADSLIIIMLIQTETLGLSQSLRKKGWKLSSEPSHHKNLWLLFLLQNILYQLTETELIMTRSLEVRSNKSGESISWLFFFFYVHLFSQECCFHYSGWGRQPRRNWVSQVEAKDDYVAEMEKYSEWIYKTNENSVLIYILESNSWCSQGQISLSHDFLFCNRQLKTPFLCCD